MYKIAAYRRSKYVNTATTREENRSGKETKLSNIVVSYCCFIKRHIWEILRTIDQNTLIRRPYGN